MEILISQIVIKIVLSIIQVISLMLNRIYQLALIPIPILILIILILIIIILIIIIIIL